MDWPQIDHRENSPVTQTTPQPTLLSWGGWPREKNSPPPLATWQSRSYRTNWATQTLLFSKPFDLAQVCHENKICSKLALTWKLTLEMAFPAHCIWNWKLNGISRTNISKVTSNSANERCTTDPLLGQEVGKNVQWGMKAWSGKYCQSDLLMLVMWGHLIALATRCWSLHIIS